MAPQFHILLAPDRPGIWAACKLNHVEGWDKPGHVGKSENDMDINRLFFLSEAKQSSGRGLQVGAGRTSTSICLFKIAAFFFLKI